MGKMEETGKAIQKLGANITLLVVLALLLLCIVGSCYAFIIS